MRLATIDARITEKRVLYRVGRRTGIFFCRAPILDCVGRRLGFFHFPSLLFSKSSEGQNRDSHSIPRRNKELHLREKKREEAESGVYPRRGCFSRLGLKGHKEHPISSRDHCPDGWFWSFFPLVPLQCIFASAASAAGLHPVPNFIH